MSKKAIFSLYIEIPNNKFDLTDQKYHPTDIHNKSLKSQQAFKKYHNKLVSTKQQYATDVDADFYFFEYGDDFKDWTDYVLSLQDMTLYNVINFYKFDRLRWLMDRGYDEVLYLDFDVICNTNLNFFDECDLSTIHIPTSPLYPELVGKMLMNEGHLGFRAPEAKKLNTNLMLNEMGLGHQQDSFNTGIFGMNKYVYDRLNYFEDFEYVVDMMCELKSDKTFPESVRQCLGFDNETVFGFRLTQRNMSFVDIDDDWHTLIKEQLRDFKFGHFLHKNFGLFL
jgi:hypothetical protein